MDIGTVLRHYKKKEVQREIIAHVEFREIGFCYGKGYGPRPSILENSLEIIELAQRGVTSFHCSEERWSNPMQLHSGLKRSELDEIRVGWDLILDIDCAHLEYSAIAADLIIKFLKSVGIRSASVKFSGNKGFHIGVPFESFPKTVSGKPIARLFPEAPRKVAAYITEKIKIPLGQRILDFESGDISKVKKKVGSTGELIRQQSFGDKTVSYLNVETFLEIDTILIASRHLYRVPYSLHEKSGLVSIPVDPDKILSFSKKDANPENLMIPSHVFLDRSKAVSDEATDLFISSFDFSLPKEKNVTDQAKTVLQIKNQTPVELFPSCIKKILEGLVDGKKRALFILISFLKHVGWGDWQIEELIFEWNKKNPEPLRDTYITGQLRYVKNKIPPLPPNCDNEAYYKSLGIKCVDCSKSRNPVSHTRRKLFILNRGKKEKIKEQPL